MNGGARPLSPSEILKFVYPARALVKAQEALHDAQLTLRFFHSKDMEEVQLLAEAESTVANLAAVWNLLAENVLTRGQAVLDEPDRVTVPPREDSPESEYPSAAMDRDDNA